MTWKQMLVGVVCVLGSAASAGAQPCGQDRESDVDRERRLLALAAIQVVNAAQADRPRYAPLRELGESPAVRAMRRSPGSVGEAARAMRFDREELLPGWRVRFVLGVDGYSIALRDASNACAFTYVSHEDGVILEARPVKHGPVLRFVPTN